MTRVGIVAAVIIIVIASIFFGFRKAARDHEKQPIASPLEQSRAFRRVDAESRKLLLVEIEKGSQPGELAADYVKTSLDAVRPLVASCGAASVSLTIVGARDIGGLVTKCDGPPCICDALFGIELVAPLQGGHAQLTSQF